jgi:hypothetical protein
VQAICPWGRQVKLARIRKGDQSLCVTKLSLNAVTIALRGVFPDIFFSDMRMLRLARLRPFFLYNLQGLVVIR